MRRTITVIAAAALGVLSVAAPALASIGNMG